jgi:hypothetical protein
MDAIKSANYYPVPAVRGSKVKQSNGMQKLYTKIINKIEDLPPKLHTKLQAKPAACSLVRSSPVNRPVTKVKKQTSPTMKKSQKTNAAMILSDDDEFYSKLTFDDSEQSLEDEIFEELEKVAHDEAKLNAAIQNFDRILLEYNDKKAKEQKAVESAAKRDEKPSAIPKPLQKSKTCSIIESKCILKKQDEKKKAAAAAAVAPKVEKALNAESFAQITSANYYQVTKSLWNLQDFDEFAKTGNQKPQLAMRKSEGAVPTPMARAKSVWDMTTPRPSYSRQSSISKIPIKSSKLSTSMMQLNASSSNLSLSYCSPPSRGLSKSSAYASTLALSTPPTNPTPQKASSTRRSSLCLASKRPESTSPRSISKYAETKASLQRRNMISSTNSINKMSISIAASKPQPSMKSAKSEMSIHGKFALKGIERQQLHARQKVGIADPNPPAKAKMRRDGDSLLDKCLVKGQELLRKAEELNDNSASRVHDKARSVVSVDGRKRDYIAKHSPAAAPTAASMTKASPVASMNTKWSSATANSTRPHRTDVPNETLNVNAITNHCTVDNQTGNHQQQRQTESEKSSKPVSQSTTRTTVTTKIITVADISPSPTLESCEIIPVVLDAAQPIDLPKDYSSDCSDDSGHISNENEDLVLKMDLKKPRKISEDLLEIFEQKKISTAKAKVIELNHVNMIKTSLEIYPTLNKTCKSEVKFFINKY